MMCHLFQGPNRRVRMYKHEGGYLVKSMPNDLPMSSMHKGVVEYRGRSFERAMRAVERHVPHAICPQQLRG